MTSASKYKTRGSVASQGTCRFKRDHRLSTGHVAANEGPAEETVEPFR